MAKRRQHTKAKSTDSRSASSTLGVDRQSVAQLAEHPVWSGEVPGAEPGGLTLTEPGKPRDRNTRLALSRSTRTWLHAQREIILAEIFHLLHHATNEDKVRVDIAKKLLDKLVPDMKDMDKGEGGGQAVQIVINGMPNRGQISASQGMAKATPEAIDAEFDEPELDK